MKEYQGFPISNFRTGLDEALEPWLLPREAFQLMKNCHCYRGVVEKINGYNPYAKMSYRNVVAPNESINGVRTTFTFTLPFAPITSNFYAYGTIVAGSTGETFSYQSDDGSNIITLLGSAGGTGTVNISGLSASITFNTAPPSSTYSSVFFEYDSASPGTYSIMGIKPYYDSTGSQSIIVFDEKRVGKIKTNQGLMIQLSGTNQNIQEIPHSYYQNTIFVGAGSVGPYTGTLGHSVEPGTLNWQLYNATTGALVASNQVTDNGFGGLIGPNVASGSINYTTGAYTITFSTNIANTDKYDSVTGVYGNLFTGSFVNFFSCWNYQYKLFFCNNVDPIFYYDGTMIQYLNTNLSVKLVTASAGVPQFDITTTLHLLAHRERLILLSPTVEGTPQVSAAYWSEAGNPLNFTNDEQLFASTSEPIRTYGLINTSLVVRFSNSERILNYTEDAFSPFRWDSTNNLWQCDGPYSVINYDSWFSSVGKPAIVSSDGVNVRRADEIIPDFTDPYRIEDNSPVPYMNQTSIVVSYGFRFDDLKEGWLCYNSSPNAEATVTKADNVLAFNYLDQTYSVYTFPFSCLGLGRILTLPTWGNTFVPWADYNLAWGDYQLSDSALLDLAGDHYDTVYELNAGTTQTVAGDSTLTPVPVLMDLMTKNFNPFIEEGQLARLGYVDLFVSANDQTTVRVQFYLNDQQYLDVNNDPAGYYQETVINLTPTDAMSPTTRQIKIWKRIYVGAVGKEHTIRIYQNEADFDSVDQYQPVFIHAIVPYFKPAGRIFN